ncbi:hypothetical protein GCM10007301_42870 [Azorhizobium oxalatiphilum]|uniref:Glycosyltransferase n=1 Tax=Azorhizobium oxalatiphilum TaxID=980631 RepID=A0A917CC73_9HYPH|nr:hypothetical protein [Azorhizobium oxalatiphilum]GGF78308.1 hypothetical protein GCM10007301_42870 [Azorhizobium oxalatiphilum]
MSKVESDAGTTPRVLVVTGYYKEDPTLIKRTIRSVATQTAKRNKVVVDHMLVADGFPQDWIDGEAVRHVRLDRAHADYGNTPRGVGTLLGIVENYDAICYCDADNWFEPQHIEACLALAAKHGSSIDYVVARRTMRRPDESVLPIAEESIEHHVDTNCYFFLPASYPWLHRFASVPNAVSSVGDRLFYAALKAAKLKMAVVQQPTVAYLCLWESLYRAVGETPPVGAKPNVDSSVVRRWLTTLSERERTIVWRLAGLATSRPQVTAEPASLQPKPTRVLVVTAYYKEGRAMLEACIASVAAQTAAAKGIATIGHMLVADGFPQDWIDGTNLRHVKLDRSHDDYGNSPRGVGALLAVSEDWDALCFLDADNRYQPEHVEKCLARAQEIGPDCDWLMASRSYRRPDWSVMPINAGPQDVDTNCFFFLRGSFHLLHHFAAQPRRLAAVGDQIFHRVLSMANLVTGRLNERTVDYLCMWANTYQVVGETPPPGARQLPDQDAIKAWLLEQPPARRLNIMRLVGLADSERRDTLTPSAPASQPAPIRASAETSVQAKVEARVDAGGSDGRSYLIGAPAKSPSLAMRRSNAAAGTAETRSHPLRTPAGATPVAADGRTYLIGATGETSASAAAFPSVAGQPALSPDLIDAPDEIETPAVLPADADKPHVRTFDVFDTLIARRCIEPSIVFDMVAARIDMPGFTSARKGAEATVARSAYTIDTIYDELAKVLELDAARAQEIKAIEIEIEIDQVLPIAENIAQIHHGDVLISDMYLGSDTIKRLLDKAGVDQKVSLVVTSDGKRSGMIWPHASDTLRIREHLGDNTRSDVLVPTSFNITSRHTSISEPTTVENVLKSIGLRPLAELCREIRLSTWSADAQTRKLQLVQASLNFPILLLSSVALLRLGEQLGKRSVLFSSRDCDMWRPLFDDMAQLGGMQRSSTYFYTSRVARTQASPSYLRYASELITDDTIVVDLCGSGWSLAHLAQKLDREDMPVFLLHQLAPVVGYERKAPSPKTCVVHNVVPPSVGGLDCSTIEMSNYTDHGMVVDVRYLLDFPVPVFAEDARDEETLARVRAQHECFRIARKLLGKHDLRGIFDLDHESISTVCTSLYQVLSRQSVLREAFGASHTLEDQSVLQRIGCSY